MGALLSLIVALLCDGAKAAWTWLKAKGLMLWTAGTVLLPQLVKWWVKYRAWRWGAVLALFYVIYSAVRSVINFFTEGLGEITGLARLISSSSWACWLIWDGPLRLCECWAVILDVLAFWASLRYLSFAVTRAEYFKDTFFNWIPKL